MPLIITSTVTEMVKLQATFMQDPGSRHAAQQSAFLFSCPGLATAWLNCRRLSSLLTKQLLCTHLYDHMAAFGIETTHIIGL